jgi:hypothetical protein
MATPARRQNLSVWQNLTLTTVGTLVGKRATPSH